MTRQVKVPGRIYPGMFPGEVQVEITPPGEEPIFLFASDRFASSGTPITSDGVLGTVLARVFQDIGDKLIVDLPGEALQRGPRVYLNKTFVRSAD